VTVEARHCYEKLWGFCIGRPPQSDMSGSSAIPFEEGVSARRSVREGWWALQKYCIRFARLAEKRNSAFAGVIARDLIAFIRGVGPADGVVTKRARAAADWLMRAQEASGDDGASYGYFPLLTPRGWQASYPETTGYIITSLLKYSQVFGDDKARASALRMARWEIAVQMPSGAVQGGILTTPEKQTPAAFNTGMVLDGLVSAAEAEGDPAFIDAARRAADFLVSDQTEEGYFRSNGAYVTASTIKTYNCLNSWSMLRFGRFVNEKRYELAAIRAVTAALKQQKPNGWFANNCLSNSAAPLLHTIGYTLQGVLEVGALAGRDDFVDAARRGAEPIAAIMRSDGFIPGRLDANWHPSVKSACLTGSAQFAIVCFRLAELTGNSWWSTVAIRVLDFLKTRQIMDSADPGINGALAGAFPILGDYQPGGYPNWATKYLLDALLHLVSGTPESA